MVRQKSTGLVWVRQVHKSAHGPQIWTPQTVKTVSLPASATETPDKVDPHKGDDHKGDDHKGDDHKGDDHKGDDDDRPIL
nr:hypothetical protein BaRGS_011357 [Batillaria attramentaria]